MQTNPLFWYLVYIKFLSTHLDGHRRPHNQRVKMSKTATIAFPDTLFGRVVAKIDALLMAWAESNIRNGDVPYIGL